jgi:hypothetical protein
MTKTFRYMTKGLVSFPEDEVWLKMCASLLRTGLIGPLAVLLVPPIVAS